MHVIIIGAGISGLSSAYYLLKEGHSVEIHETARHVAARASGANAAQLSYTYMNPIGSPDLFKMLPGILLGHYPGFKINHIDREMCMWGLRLLGQSTRSKFIRNRNALLSLSLKSKALMAEMLEDTSITFKRYSSGKLQLVHTEALKEDTQQFANELANKHNIKQQWFEAEQCEEQLPSMSILDETTLGAIYSDADEAANCERFCNDLFAYLNAQPNFSIHFHSKVTRWSLHKQRIKSIETSDGKWHKADAVLLCTGAKTNQLTKPLGLTFPIYPVKGYTICYHHNPGLGYSVTDHANKVVFVPYGDDAVLVSGMFHLDGYDRKANEHAISHIHTCAQARLPKLNQDSFEIRTGLRPCTPSSLPVIGQTKYNNLYINSGQGMYGWTLATACAEQVAGLMGD